MNYIDEYETYQASPEIHGKGTFFLADCGNQMYSIENDYNARHETICPRCGKILLAHGTPEAKEYWDSRLKEMGDKNVYRTGKIGTSAMG